MVTCYVVLLDRVRVRVRVRVGPVSIKEWSLYSNMFVLLYCYSQLKLNIDIVILIIGNYIRSL